MTLRHELPGAGGENFGHMNDAIAAFVPDSIDQYKPLVAAGHELVTSVKSDRGMEHIAPEQLESIVPAEDQGSFIMRIKELVTDHKKIAGTVSVVVTGSALLAAYIHQRRKK